jgi:hypothetical protein
MKPMVASLSSLSSFFFNQRLKRPPQGGFLLSVVVGNLRLAHRALRSQNVRPFGRKVAVLQAFAFVWTIDARVALLRLRARTLMTPEYQLSAVAPRPPVSSGYPRFPDFTAAHGRSPMRLRDILHDHFPDVVALAVQHCLGAINRHADDSLR